MKRGVTLAALAVVLLVFGAAWAARAAEGRRAIAEADAALARGDVFDAIMAARAAAESRCPGCSAPEEGYGRLERIAKDAEGRADDAAAFAAWRATRAALLATAAASTSSERRARAETEIARFAHRMDVAATAAGAAPTPAAAQDKLAAALAERAPPSGAAFAVIAAGGAVFLWAALRFALAKAARRADLATAAAGAAAALAGAALF